MDKELASPTGTRNEAKIGTESEPAETLVSLVVIEGTQCRDGVSISDRNKHSALASDWNKE